jgi:hypothetical protein
MLSSGPIGHPLRTANTQMDLDCWIGHASCRHQIFIHDSDSWSETAACQLLWGASSNRFLWCNLLVQGYPLLQILNAWTSLMKLSLYIVLAAHFTSWTPPMSLFFFLPLCVCVCVGGGSSARACVHACVSPLLLLVGKGSLKCIHPFIARQQLSKHMPLQLILATAELQEVSLSLWSVS